MTTSEQAVRKAGRERLLPLEYCAPGYREDAERAARWLKLYRFDKLSAITQAAHARRFAPSLD
jgi:hypothetical protein